MKKFYLAILLLIGFSYPSFSQLAPAALGFDGVDDKVTIPANPQYVLGTGDFTVEFWFRSATVNGGAPYSSTLFDLNSASFGGIRILLTNGRPNFVWGSTSTGGTTGGPDFRDSVCHHLAFRRTANVLTYVIDGLVCPVSYSAINLPATGPITIGNSSFPNSAFKGSIKEVRFWNRSLSVNELINGFSQVYTSSAFQLTGYWRMNATSGQSVTDYSVNANHGTLGATVNVETSDPFFTTACPSCTPPIASISPFGSSTVCAGDSILLTANSGAGFTYQWYKDGAAIAGATNITYYAKQDGLHYVRVKNANGCETYSVAKDVIVPSVRYINLICNVPVIYGSACLNNGTVVLTAAGGNSKLWYKNGVSTGQTGNSITISSSQSGIYHCRIIAGQCTVLTNTINVKQFTSEITAPFTAFCNQGPTIYVTNNYNSFSANGVFMQNGVQIGIGTFTVPSVSGDVYYIENPSTGVCPVPIVSNTLNIQAGSPPQVLFSHTPVQSPVTGNDVIDTCVNLPGYIYLLQVEGFNPAEVGPQIYWTLPTGLSGSAFSPSIYADINGQYHCFAANQCGMGSSLYPFVRVLNAASPPSISGDSTGCPSVQLSMGDFYDSYQWYLNGVMIPGAVNYNYAATQSGTYTCLISNTCGSLLSNPKVVTLTPPNAIISAPSPMAICNGSKIITATPAGGTYKWLKNNVVIAGAVSQTYTATSGGSYSAIVTLACGSDTSNIITLAGYSAAPSTPGAMTGPTRVCPGTNGVVFTVPTSANTTGYYWTIPVGMTMVNFSSNASTTTVTVNVSSSFVSGDVKIRFGNLCGWSADRIKTVRTIIPASPGAVTGPTYGVCNSTQSYSIAAVSQATTYLWIAPPGASIVSGQGTTNVTVSFPSNYGTDTLRVSAGNSCAYGPVRKVVVRGKPLTPGAITGPATACNGQTGVQFSITPVSGANTYTWNKPTGSTITSGQNTLTATITFGSNSGNVTVKAVNGCGTSGASTKAITINCREGEMSSQPLSVFPNPTNDEFKLTGSIPEEGITLQLFDLTGKLVLTELVHAEYKFGSGLIPGVYIVRLTSANSEKHLRLVKQ